MAWTTVYISGKSDFRQEVRRKLSHSSLPHMPGFMEARHGAWFNDLSHQDIGIFSLIVFIRPLVRHGKEKHLFVTQQVLKIIGEIGGFFFVLKHNEVAGTNAFVNGGQDNGIQTTKKAF